MTNSDDDLALLQRWRTGERDAGNELVRRHFRTVYRFFRSKLDGDVEDLVQRTFVTCAKVEFRGQSRFTTFLLGIARNLLLQHLRDVKRRPQPESLSVAELRDPASPSRQILLQQRQQLLMTALQRLSLDLQTTVELYYWEQLTLPEIATVLEVPVGTIKSRLARARDLLRRHLAELTGAPAEDFDDPERVAAWAEDLRGAVDNSASR
ncbi:MAG: sigma-70 family RNA polymerase sigma factor [Nannocystaceae bacterium]|nr:sigma-70 family RNA polymerase sigma factor [Nannocystaceae bacterium]